MSEHDDDEVWTEQDTVTFRRLLSRLPDSARDELRLELNREFARRKRDKGRVKSYGARSTRKNCELLTNGLLSVRRHKNENQS